MSDNTGDFELKPVKSELEKLVYNDNLNMYELVKY